MKRMLVAATAATVLSLAAPITEVHAQDAAAEDDDDSDKTGLWGLLGLAGLAGLAGLKRRDREVHRSTYADRTTTPPPGPGTTRP